jgi:translation initiation factor IF-2
VKDLRVYEYAKSLNMSSKEIITILKRINIPVNNHMSVLEEGTVEKVEQFFKDIKAGAAGNRPKPAVSTAPSTDKATPSVTQNEAPKKPVEAKGSVTSPARGTQQGTPSAHRKPAPRSEHKPNPQAGNNPRPNNRPQNTTRTNEGTNKLQNTATNTTQLDDQYSKGKDVAGVNGKVTKKTKPNQKRFDDNRVSNIKQNGKNRNNNRNRYQQQNQQQKKDKVDNTPKKVIIRGSMSVKEVASALVKQPSEIIKKLFLSGIVANINQELDMDTIEVIATDYGVEVERKIAVNEDNFETVEENDNPEDLLERPPVVTIMGHVDHGKTTLLDAIRQTNVTAGEAGGITQHIGAYQVEINKKKITFLDTPGHAAFTTMRARGAQVTDITILVVAADDGVMPQTVEAISHAKAANVPIIVAVNKIDKPAANPDRVKQELTEHGLVPEDWGGDAIFVHVSALQRQGLEDLLEMILLVSEVQELKANPNKRARGTVIEAELDKGRGAVATILVQNGTLKVGDALVIGSGFGRIRAMVNDKGKKIKEAGPSTPVEIIGLQEVPNAGDPFMAFEDERKARSIAESRSVTQRQSELNTTARVTLDDLYKQIQQGEVKDLNVIIKGDVQGSVEALRGSLEKIDIEGVRVKILHTGVGAITESDVILAAASNAIVVGFNVRPDQNARLRSEQDQVDVRLHRVIYNVIDEIEAALKGMLDPEYKEVVIGRAEVREVFKVSKVGSIAGSYVIDGKITRSAKARVIRQGIVVHEGGIDTLKRFKDDAKEVNQGYECGITLENFNDVKEGDIVEAYVMEEIKR